MYLLSSASPAATPATSHQAPCRSPCSRPSAHSATVQNSSSGVSGVMVTAPTPNSSVAFSSTAAATPARRPGSRSSAAAPDQHGCRAPPPAGRAAARPARVSPTSPRAGPDPQRHHRRMVEIAGRQRARPDPVIGLVRGQGRQAATRTPRQQGKAEPGALPWTPPRAAGPWNPLVSVLAKHLLEEWVPGLALAGSGHALAFLQRHARQCPAGADGLQRLHPADVRRPGQPLRSAGSRARCRAPPAAAGSRRRRGSCGTRAPPASRRPCCSKADSTASFWLSSPTMAKKVIAQPELLRVGVGVVAADDAGLLQPADAAQAGRRGDAGAAGQLHIGHAAVGLQFGQDAAVDGVEVGRLGQAAASSCGGASVDGRAGRRPTQYYSSTARASIIARCVAARAMRMLPCPARARADMVGVHASAGSQPCPTPTAPAS